MLASKNVLWRTLCVVIMLATLLGARVCAQPNKAIENALGGTGAAAPNSWETIRPLAVDLASRPAALIDEPANGQLAAPKMRGTGGAAAVYVNAGMVLRPVENYQADAAMLTYVSRHGGGTQNAAQLKAQFMNLLRAGESELRRRGLPVDSIGSALEFTLASDYEIAVGPQSLSPSQTHALRGDIAFQIAVLESSANAGYYGDEQREQRYQELLVSAQNLRNGYLAAPHGTDAAGYREQAIKDLAKFGIDPAKFPLARAECALPSSKSCDAFLADATPIFDRIADKFPY